MKNRAIILIAAILGALILLGAILTLDRLGGDLRSAEGYGAADDQNQGLTVTDDLPGFDPNNVGQAGNIKPGEVEQYRFEQINSHGQLVQFFGDRLIPQPGGVVEVVNPICRVHLIARQRILQVRANQGTFLAPEDRPQSGELAGNVIVQLFDSNNAGPVSTDDDSPHLDLQVTLPRARFDLDLGQLTSDEEVLVSGPRLRFEGTGLQLSYNALRNRIDRLVIEKGKRLWFKHQRDAQVAESSTGDHQNQEAGEPASARDQDADEEQLVYHAAFEKNVNVISPEAVIEADQLDVLFSLSDSADSVSISDASTADASDRPIALLPTITRTVSQWPATVSLIHRFAPQGAALFRSLMPLVLGQVDNDGQPSAQSIDMEPSEDAVLITWEGRMVVVPQLEASDMLASNDELMITLTGNPLTVTTTDEEVITGARLTYASGLSLMTIEAASTESPLTITSPQLGVLTGAKLTLDQAKGRGKLAGPGRLVAAQPQKDGEPSGLADMTVDFAKHVDLDLLAAEEAETDARPRMNLAGIRSARFVGEVMIGHPRFDMTSDTLDVEIDNSTQPASVQQIVAHGNATARSHATDAEPASSIQGQSITLDLKTTESGQVQPSRLTAAGGVVARQQTRVLMTGRLEADLAPQQSASSEGDAGLLVTQVRASQGVEAKLDEQEIDVFANSLVATPDNNQIDLFGSDEQPARIERPDGTLRGKHVILLAESENIVVPGPGTAEFYPEPDNAEGAEPAAESDSLKVTWSKRMRFDNSNNFAEFEGDVSARASDDTQRTSLESNSLRLDFVPQREGVALRRASEADRQKIARSIRKITAEENVEFMSESFDDRLGGNLQTRMTVKGPLVNFDGPTEQVHVIGPGTMLIEDYRPDRNPDSDRQGELAKFSGRGATAFKWTGSLMLDAKNNDMKVEENVVMGHRPAGEAKPSVMRAARFIADLQETGGLGAWMSSEAPKPRLNGAFADGGRNRVEVKLNNRTITTDRLEYRAVEQMLQLRANAGNVTTVMNDKDGKGVTAQAINYDLDSGDIEILQMGAVKAPAR